MSTPTNQRARAVFWLQVASLLATGWVIRRVAFFPFGAQNFLPEAVVVALWYSFCALALSGVITYLLLLTMQRIAREEALHVTLRTCAAGMWFAPAVILLSASSPLAVTAALALVVSVTRVLYSQWRLGPARAVETVDETVKPDALLTGELPHGFLPRDFWPAFVSAAALQAGFVFSHLAQRSLSGACYALGAAVLTAYSIAAGAWKRHGEPTLPRSILAIAVTLMLTVLITIIGMQMYGGSGSGDETAGNGTSSHRSAEPATEGTDGAAGRLRTAADRPIANGAKRERSRRSAWCDSVARDAAGTDAGRADAEGRAGPPRSIAPVRDSVRRLVLDVSHGVHAAAGELDRTARHADGDLFQDSGRLAA